MEKKFFDVGLITLDGRMDEPVWDQVEEHSDFLNLNINGGGLADDQTSFKIIPCADRIYIGVKCMESDMEGTLRATEAWSGWGSNSIELFFSPSGNPNAFYQFFISQKGNRMYKYYEEGGGVQPDRYMPDIKSAVYHGKDFWSLEMEFPLTAFYMTPYETWTDKWILNIARSRRLQKRSASNSVDIFFTTWSRLNKNFKEIKRFRTLGGFPVIPKEDDVHISAGFVDMTEQDADGYHGIMTVKALSAVAGTYEFSSDHADTQMVTLEEGHNTFTVPCHYPECVRFKTKLTLKRLEDGKEFTRYYPVRVDFEPIRILFTQPEYRRNFYPGQDYSRIVGRVKSHKAVTLHLEGPGIEPQTLTPDADGSFVFETPNFEYGAAFLTATAEGYEVRKKIRRLAPTGKTMSWISGGNLIVNGKPYMRRNMYSPYYNTGEYCNRLYDTENIHESNETKSYVPILPHYIDPTCEHAGGEATLDGMPSEKMIKAFDLILERSKDKNFTHYYLTDEPDLRELSPIYFKNIYEYFAERDPYHVIWISIRFADEYIECGDWFETDPYLDAMPDENGVRVYDRPINMMGRYIDNVVELNRPDKCIGFVGTCFAYRNFNPHADYPTFDELNTHIWSAMIHGGKTLCSYVCYDLYDRPALHRGMSYVFESFEVLGDLVLLGKRTDLIKNQDVHAVLYDKGDEQMFVLVNMTQEPQTATLEGLTGQWHHFRNGGMITGNTFNLKPLETVIGTSEVKDAGIVTYAEMAARIEKEEYERTHGGSLLFNRQEDIEVTASVPFTRSGPYKLFDGVKKNYGWKANGADTFFEMDLSKVKPTIHKLVIHGYNLDGMNIFVKNNGVQTPLEYAEKQEKEFDTTYILKDSITPDVMRMEFNSVAGYSELYEIEAF